MKKNVILLVLSSLLLCGCTGRSDPHNTSGVNPSGGDSSGDTSHGTSTPSGDTSGGGGDTPVTNRTIQDTTILHAWNWNIKGITERLDDIKNAGFKTIQLSPMQHQKDYYWDPTYAKWGGQWWKLYQPLGFYIANQDGQNVLGKKSDIATLCSEAKKKDIKVIVDIVSNHLAGGNKDLLNNNVQSGFDSSKIHHLNKDADDNDQQSIVQGNIGDYPDLKTEDSFVQGKVLELLKEYIDVGISGFRFDAAKHIETSKDGAYASNFWENTLEKAKAYYKTKNSDELYAYGEILTTCGKNRSYSFYTDKMSVIDNKQGERILNGIKSNSTANLSKTDFETGVSADKLVLWAESHDTYANDSHETTGVSQENIDKAYVVQASRKDAASLYLARPGSVDTLFGVIDNDSYKSNVVSAINNFHNLYVGMNENISINNGAFVNVRGEGAKAGAVVVNVSGSVSSVQLSLSGDFIDLVTGREVKLSGGTASISFTKGVSILVPKALYVKPTVSLSYGDQVYSGAKTVTVTTTNATQVKYSINNGAEQVLSGNQITLANTLANGAINLKVRALNDNNEASESVLLLKTDKLLSNNLIIYDIDTNYTYFAWMWQGSGAGSWTSFIIDGTAMGLNKGSNNKIIIVKFAKGTTTANWDNKLGQTDDLDMPSARLNSFSSFLIK